MFLAGWREGSGTLFVPVLSEARVGDDVAIRVGLYGHTIRATLFGKVGMVRRVGRPSLPPGIELHLEKHSVAAAGFLAMAARGEQIAFKDRQPRWSVRRDLQVRVRGEFLGVVTVNISEGGCSVLWPGEAPRVGDEVLVWMARGLFSPSVRGIVCWSQPDEGGQSLVGLKVAFGGRGGRAWRSFVDEVSRAGAPNA